MSFNLGSDKNALATSSYDGFQFQYELFHAIPFVYLYEFFSRRVLGGSGNVTLNLKVDWMGGGGGSLRITILPSVWQTFTIPCDLSLFLLFAASHRLV